MPHWVSRQWRVLGATRHAFHTRTYRPTGQWCAATYGAAIRTYVLQSGEIQSEFLPIRNINSAIIIPRSVHTTTPDDLIQHIKPLHKHSFRKTTFPVFLLTPAFATWLLDDQTFLQKALHQAFNDVFQTSQSYKRLHVLVAVVDKLPTPQSIGNPRALLEEAFQRTQNPQVSDSGHEGMAYAFLSSAHVVNPPLRSISDVGNGSLSFTMVRSHEKGEYRDVFELPLANTVFQTGSATTMNLSTWHRVRGNKALQLLSKSSPNHHGIAIDGDGKARTTSALSIPLVPLTVPRRVEESMGNIVRRISDADEKAVTASEELEKVVPQYLKSRDEPAQTISVWALVIPKGSVQFITDESMQLLDVARKRTDLRESHSVLNSWQALWSCNPPLPNQLVTAALMRNARLHRVLSGGGGWGKKAGLLSLEPGISQNDWTMLSTDNQDQLSDLQDLSSALNTVVQPGDSIQFFVSPSASKAGTNGFSEASKAHRQFQAQSPLWTWEIGTIPSTIDCTPSTSLRQGTSDTNDVFVFRNSFGALSEEGMQVTRQFRTKATKEWGPREGTKIDVPFSRFSLVNIDDLVPLKISQKTMFH
ncbi:uncharacterized protein BDR25DRAFT_36519 [Lindgomyces ingoldianus]|uniref:Uncharacterized protein n=1 Tax=Lindgomyces ingoldianus TaxID=673940 RepID=A0ACB6QU24_9PLEO|nr:uncharacterized protein BDR25DRAFT_36519 [Lindgomyces ingoldianus]KAF2470078.1 hypothetical protein BDR25DRAFT_36519 [Lindgomyces ingoldianus]